MYDLILTYILKKFNRFKSVLHIKKRSAKSAFLSDYFFLLIVLPFGYLVVVPVERPFE